MKKIININLSGRVIPIEDSAYEKLKDYIESLRRYFVKEEDRDEIINDIESRIAELMNDKIRKGSAAITDADINEIAASMGRPEDFAAEDEGPARYTQSSAAQDEAAPRVGKKPRGRLFRDTSDKFLGGVCSGIAAYLNIDPAIVRILFAIITFGGFGLGFLVYIILWIVLPGKDLDNRMGKRLYRNPEDRVIGGVAGGLAAYFNRETWVIRLIFSAPLLLSIVFGLIRGLTWHYDFEFVPNVVFGSLTSTFIIAYIILWIVLPEARSTYEKMEMRGEKVDVNTIAQNMKVRMKEWGEEVKESAENLGAKAKEFANTRGKTFASEVNDTTRRSGSGCLHAIGVLFKVFFLFIAGVIAFGLFVALITLISGGIAWWPINHFLWTSKWQQAYAWGTLIFFLAVPLIAFITWLIRRIIKVRSRGSYLGWVFGSLWALGWVAVVLFIASMAKDFRSYEATKGRNIEIVQPSNGRMTIGVTEPKLTYTGQFNWVSSKSEGWDLSPDTMKLSLVDFRIEKSLDSMYYVTVIGHSFGRNPADAISRAEKLHYAVVLKDSILDLASGFAISKTDKWRGQRVEIIVKVPVGKVIRFDESVKRKLNAANARYGDNNRFRGDNIDFVFNDNAWFWWRSNTDYTMQDDGKLLDPSNNKIIDNEYRYERDWEDAPQIKQEREKRQQQEKLEERERKLKEELRGIEEEKRRQNPQRDSVVKESMDDKDDDGIMAGSSIPTFSLVKTFF